MQREKNLLVAYILWLLLGILGAHKFYLRRPFMGVLYFCTAGLIVIGWLIDLFTLPQQVDEYNERYYLDDYFDDYREEEMEDLIDEISELREMISSDSSAKELKRINQRLAELEQVVGSKNQPS